MTPPLHYPATAPRENYPVFAPRRLRGHTSVPLRGHEYRVIWRRPGWDAKSYGRRYFQYWWCAERFYDQLKGGYGRYGERFGPFTDVRIERRPVGEWREGLR